MGWGNIEGFYRRKSFCIELQEWQEKRNEISKIQDKQYPCQQTGTVSILLLVRTVWNACIHFTCAFS